MANLYLELIEQQDHQRAVRREAEAGRGNFLSSAISAATVEMVGLEPLAGVEAYRTRNPNAGLISEFAGILTPYGFWAAPARFISGAARVGSLGMIGAETAARVGTGIASRVPGLTRFDNFITRLGGAPGEIPSIRRAMLQSTARFAPFEAGRVAGAAALGGDIGQTAGEALVNLGIEAAAGGLVGAVRAFGTRPRNTLDYIPPGGRIDDPLQTRSRLLQQELSGMDVNTPTEHMARVQDALRETRQLIREQRPLYWTTRSGQRQNTYLPHGIADPRHTVKEQRHTQRNFTRFWNRTERQSPGNSKAVSGPLSIDAEEGLPRGAIDRMQYAREIAGTPEALTRFKNDILSRMTRINDDMFLTREGQEGLWVIARRIDPQRGLALSQKEAIRPGIERWAFFKTDDPGFFNPRGTAWQDVLRKEWGLKATDEIPTVEFSRGGSEPVLDMKSPSQIARGYAQTAQYTADLGVFEGRPASFISRASKKLGLDRIADSELARRGHEFLRLVKPAIWEQASLRGRRASSLLRATFDEANKVASTVLYGAPEYRTFKDWLLRGSRSTHGVVPAINNATEEALRDLSTVLVRSADEAARLGAAGDSFTDDIWNSFVEQLARDGEISADGLTLVRELAKADAALLAETNAVEKALGLRLGFRPLPGHLLITRSWVGKFRTEIKNAQGDRIWITGGHDRGQSQRAADEVIRRMEAAGAKGLTRGSTFPKDQAADLRLAVGLRHDADEYRAAAKAFRDITREVGRPGSFKQRSGVGGARGESPDRPYTRRELIDTITAHVEGRTKYLGELVWRHGAREELWKLQVENIDDFNRVQKRLNDYTGRLGPFSQSINRAVDKVLAPVIGPDSASRIVAQANRFVFNWELGMGNLMFPVVNALTFMQTVLPQIAFVMKADANTLRAHYHTLPVAGKDGLVRGSMGVLSPLKISYQGLKLLRSIEKDPQAKRLFERGIADRTVEPQFVEHFAGQKASVWQRLREKGNFIDAVEAYSSFAPSVTERLSRGHAFSVGLVLGRLMKITDEELLYRLARDFTDNTMFQYGAANRARIITGPLGSLFGLFKNWQMHYTGWMLTFGKEGLLRNNWSPMLWQLAGTGAVAGAKGLPLYGVADAFSRWASDESLMSNIYEMFGGTERDSPHMSDAIYMGLPAILHTSLTSSTAAPFSDPARDASMFFSFVHWNRAKAIGQMAGDAVERAFTTGEHPIVDEDTRRLFVRGFAPRSVYRAMSVLEDDFIRSASTGYPQVGGLSWMERAMYGMGFNPRWLSLQFDVQHELWAEQNKLRAGIARYGDFVAEAMLAQDWRAVTNYLSRATAQGLPSDSILNSARTRVHRAQTPTVQAQFDQERLTDFVRRGLTTWTGT